jgi:hypothetical protein
MGLGWLDQPETSDGREPLGSWQAAFCLEARFGTRLPGANRRRPRRRLVVSVVSADVVWSLPSAFITEIHERRSRSCLEKAISRPSGDHCGSSSFCTPRE